MDKLIEPELGHAEFLSDLNDEEVAIWVKDNELGWGKVKNKLKDILGL